MARKLPVLASIPVVSFLVTAALKLASRLRPACLRITNPAIVVAAIAESPAPANQQGDHDECGNFCDGQQQNSDDDPFHHVVFPARPRLARGQGSSNVEAKHDPGWVDRHASRCQYQRAYIIAADGLAGLRLGRSGFDPSARPPQEHARRVRYLHHHLPGSRGLHLSAFAQRARPAHRPRAAAVRPVCKPRSRAHADDRRQRGHASWPRRGQGPGRAAARRRRRPLEGHCGATARARGLARCHRPRRQHVRSRRASSAARRLPTR